MVATAIIANFYLFATFTNLREFEPYIHMVYLRASHYTPAMAVWEMVLPAIVVQQVLPRVVVEREVVLSVQFAREGGPAGHGHARRRARRPR